MSRLSRRELIAVLLGCPLIGTLGCSKRGALPQGELRTTNFEIGHRIRDGRSNIASIEQLASKKVVIVGGGVAGLTAAWRLKMGGFDDFVLLELEDQLGGTSRSGSTANHGYPWGAHYIPVPMPHNRALIQLLSEMGVVESIDEDGVPSVGEQFLCRDPEERLFVGGTWMEGMYPFASASEDDLLQLAAFREEIDRWAVARDANGRRMFAVPRSTGSDCSEVRDLDKISMSDWLNQFGWDSPPLLWAVNYACRDDYGLTSEQTSAWAGIFYFASRLSGAGADAQEVITWPEGNGRVVRHLAEALGDHIQSNTAVCRIEPMRTGDSAAGGGVRVEAINTLDGHGRGWAAERVICAAPQMISRYMIPQDWRAPDLATDAFRYGSWIVANVHLNNRPRSTGFPLSWDNVSYESSSLGYVNCTHQIGLDHGPTVLTWYHPFADVDSSKMRQEMMRLEWSDWAELVMDDLRRVHRDIDGLVERVDVMLWGHAMIQPRVGFAWSDALQSASTARGPVHFAGTDLSGIALFEEALDHGVRAAEEVMIALGHESTSLRAGSNAIHS